METVDKKEVTKRFKTMPLNLLDSETLGSTFCSDFKRIQDSRSDYFRKREEWTSNWRDLSLENYQGPWENSSNYHVPLTLIYGKAIHAKLWQLFSQDYFDVKARLEVFESKVPAIQNFMKFVMEDYANGKAGTRDVFDTVLWDNVFDGSGYVKVFWQRDEHTYAEVVPVLEVEETMTFDRENLTGVSNITSTKLKEEEKIKTEVIATPWIKRCLLEDVVMPVGAEDPQSAPYVFHRFYLTSEDLKARGREGKFDPEAVKKVIDHKTAMATHDSDTAIKRDRMYQEGFDSDGYYDQYHVILERYGKAYVKKNIDGKEEFDYDEKAEEIVIWIHQATQEILGWTYLFRISPSGIRPIFKFDFIKFPDRTNGVGVAEILASTNKAVDAIYNLRQDNGVLASTPMGFYRSGSGMKPDRYRISPGEFIPVDDPQGDVRVLQLPFLQGFGYQEEDRLTSYAEKTLAVDDMTMGRSPSKVGMFRTASGANAYEQAAAIQLEIHFDRAARTLSKLLQCIFRLSREQIPSELFFRVTGENGQPIFGKVNREDLRAEVDFEIKTDLLSQSRIEAQQQGTMLMQTFLNPTLLQMGVVTPSNVYNLSKNFLQKNKVKRIDNYITKPKDYSGEVITPQERLFRIAVNMFEMPAIEDTVRMDENHEEALQIMDAFEKSTEFGLYTNPKQIGAFKRLKAKHMQMLQTMNSPQMVNTSGTQMPSQGMEAMSAMDSGAAPSQGTLGAPQGEVNGPVY